MLKRNQTKFLSTTFGLTVAGLVALNHLSCMPPMRGNKIDVQGTEFSQISF